MIKVHLKTALLIICLITTIPLLASNKKIKDKQNEQGKVIDKEFLIMTGILTASKIYDIETTFILKNKYPDNSYEANPIMRPFIKSDRPAAYAYITGINAAVVYSSWKLKKKKKKWWMMLIIISTAAGFLGGTNNLVLIIHK